MYARERGSEMREFEWENRAKGNASITAQAPGAQAKAA